MSFSTPQHAKKERRIIDLDTEMMVSKQYEYFSVLSTRIFFWFFVVVYLANIKL